MRTSSSQFQLLVEFMERNGDLSKPIEGPQGRANNIQRWEELKNLLNADATGDTKTVEKWRKVWSDFKNNTKKKAARMYRSARGTGGGPASNIKLSAMEERVINLIGTRAATGIVKIPEVGLEDEGTAQPPMSDDCHVIISQQHDQETHCTTEDWNLPGTSSQPPLFPLIQVDSGQPKASGIATVGRSPLTSATALHVVDSEPAARSSPLRPSSAGHHVPQSPTPLPRTPRRRRRGQDPSSPIRRIRTRTQTQSELARQAFVRSDCEWRAFQQETERERNRLRQLEIRNEERWLDLFGEFIALGNRLINILEKK